MNFDHPFIGREAEMARLNHLLDKRSASLIAVCGRRRIGKSRLLKEFGKQMRSFFFSGLPPSKKRKYSARSQRREFAFQMKEQGLGVVSTEDWTPIFSHLAKATQKGRVLIVLDEISWMGSRDPEFLGKLKNAWDLHFSNNPQLILAVCSSISSWIEKNILSSTGYFGRVSLILTLEELSLRACNDFWQPKAERISSYEKFKTLGVTGGVPLYLEQIHPDVSAEQNIRDLCFIKGGLLVREFDQIFSDLFSRRSATYKAIVENLCEGPKSLKEIQLALKKSKGGVYKRYLDDLVLAGYVRRDFSWELKTAKTGRLSRYRLSDNYLRFYLKYVAPHQAQIQNNLFTGTSLTALPGWETLMGLQFENLVVQNRFRLWQTLGLLPQDILVEGPFHQTSTQQRKGCQIDYLIQTRSSTLYLCEIKFCKGPVGGSVIEEVEGKIKALALPKHCSLRAILIHVNGVEEVVLDRRYFDRIVDFGAFLRE